MNLQELKQKSPTELLAFAEQHNVENANSLRTQDMMFAILKQLAEENVEITGIGVLEILQDGFGFLRSPALHYALAIQLREKFVLLKKENATLHCYA